MKKIKLRRRRMLSAIMLTALTIGFSLSFAKWKTNAAGTITGQVFQDFNGNGNYDTNGVAPNYAIDAGLGGVIVSVYDASGTLRGTATTAAGGTYSLAATGTGPYRVEFTNLPAGYSPSAHSTDSVSGGTAADSGSTVQFVADGATANVNLAVSRPSEYCQNNPLVCSTVMTYAGTSGTNNERDIVTFPYSNADDLDGNINGTTTDTGSGVLYSPSRPTAATIAKTNDAGANYGVAYDKNTKKIYTSAFLKRKAASGGIANETTGGIYVSDPAAGSTSLYVDLNQVFPGSTGANPHPRATTTWINDTATRDLVGKRGLGDIDISEDGKTLYVVNLNDRRLYAVPTSGALDSTTIKSYAVPTDNQPTSGSPGTCAPADVRPFGIGIDASGQVYVGGVCSAESTGGTYAAPVLKDLVMYVWKFDGANFSLIFYNRFDSTSSTGLFYPWQTVYSQDSRSSIEKQPMLADIVFDHGNMILGIRDRSGDQVPADGIGILSSPYKRGVGNIYRACVNGASWLMEANAKCGSITTAGSGNNQGLGGGEYYYQDFTGDGYSEASSGALLQIPGHPEVMASAYDAVNQGTTGAVTHNYNSGGVQKFNNTTGQYTGAYDIYTYTDSASGNAFAKANGLGDIEAMCDSAPIEIGNRVWRDLDGDGVQDPGEAGIAGVTVHLYDSAGNIIATAVTDANGEYYFSSATGTSSGSGIYGVNILPGSGYTIRFDNPADYAPGGVLSGLFLTKPDVSTQAGSTNGSDSDAYLTTNPTGSPSGTFPVISVTTGAAGQNDHTFDAGFAAAVPTAAAADIGGRVLDSRWRGISGARVVLTTQGGKQKTVMTNSFGYFRFSDVPGGATAVISASAKGYSFNQPQALTITEDMDEIYLIASTNKIIQIR